MKHSEATLIMDSGAFSAWSKGSEIDLEAYVEYCLEHLDGIDYVVNLDCIPAAPGQKRISQEEIERSASLGWKNYSYMLKRGIPKDKLVHVFHQNENWKWLKRMVELMPYIGLSPANDRTTPEKIAWLDECMKYVTDDDGFPIVKFHGFAVTSHRIMDRYPWYSVDSSSWVIQAGYGVVYVPYGSPGNWDFLSAPQVVFFSNTSPKLSETGLKHYDRMPPTQQKQVDAYLEEIGVVIGSSDTVPMPEDHKLADNEKKTRAGELEIIYEEGVANTYLHRVYTNAYFLSKYQDAIVPWPKKAFKTPKLKGLGL